jgi:signal transduction histidine kinase
LETVGKPIMDLHLIYEPDIPIVKRNIAKLTNGETKVVSSNRNITKEGKVIYCTWINSALLDEKGKMVSVFSFVEDNTTRVNAENALEENNRNLEKLVEERTKQLKDSERLAAIGATAGMVGHDIRNPLQAITSDVYLAKTDLALTPESEEKSNVQESLEEIEANVSYINKIVADLQDFARPLSPKLEEIDFEKTVHSVLASINIPGNVTVKHSIRKDFPKLKVDQSYIQRILANLSNNAIQAMPNGGKLTITAASKNGKAVITVEDNGEGIPESVRSKLFTPLVTTKSRGQGFG